MNANHSDALAFEKEEEEEEELSYLDIPDLPKWPCGHSVHETESGANLVHDVSETNDGCDRNGEEEEDNDDDPDDPDDDAQYRYRKRNEFAILSHRTNIPSVSQYFNFDFGIGREEDGDDNDGENSVPPAQQAPNRDAEEASLCITDSDPMMRLLFSDTEVDDKEEGGGGRRKAPFAISLPNSASVLGQDEPRKTAAAVDSDANSWSLAVPSPRARISRLLSPRASPASPRFISVLTKAAATDSAVAKTLSIASERDGSAISCIPQTTTATSPRYKSRIIGEAPAPPDHIIASLKRAADEGVAVRIEKLPVLPRYSSSSSSSSSSSHAAPSSPREHITPRRLRSVGGASQSPRPYDFYRGALGMWNDAKHPQRKKVFALVCTEMADEISTLIQLNVSWRDFITQGGFVGARIILPVSDILRETHIWSRRVQQWKLVANFRSVVVIGMPAKKWALLEQGFAKSRVSQRSDLEKNLDSLLFNDTSSGKHRLESDPTQPPPSPLLHHSSKTEPLEFFAPEGGANGAERAFRLLIRPFFRFFEDAMEKWKKHENVIEKLVIRDHLPPPVQEIVILASRANRLCMQPLACSRALLFRLMPRASLKRPGPASRLPLDTIACDRIDECENHLRACLSNYESIDLEQRDFVPFGFAAATPSKKNRPSSAKPSLARRTSAIKTNRSRNSSRNAKACVKIKEVKETPLDRASLSALCPNPRAPFYSCELTQGVRLQRDLEHFDIDLQHKSRADLYSLTVWLHRCLRLSRLVLRECDYRYDRPSQKDATMRAAFYALQQQSECNDSSRMAPRKRDSRNSARESMFCRFLFLSKCLPSLCTISFIRCTNLFVPATWERNLGEFAHPVSDHILGATENTFSRETISLEASSAISDAVDSLPSCGVIILRNCTMNMGPVASTTSSLCFNPSYNGEMDDGREEESDHDVEEDDDALFRILSALYACARRIVFIDMHISKAQYERARYAFLQQYKEWDRFDFSRCTWDYRAFQEAVSRSRSSKYRVLETTNSDAS